uniref:Uncharacterized protein n=1 Tax=Steinernema glaseri TaxID=37863 RepID=A0A1I7ZV54_9BILA
MSDADCTHYDDDDERGEPRGDDITVLSGAFRNVSEFLGLRCCCCGRRYGAGRCPKGGPTGGAGALRPWSVFASRSSDESIGVVLPG